ncbi:MAG TPA: 2Fe-2S iron-sulfur cluster-binding protein [Candidatus Krumholzibacteria bacterium]|jgi:aerobic carbon-monoxide dehydrogenase small subunit|nr:2Fe-2S iron-sulfur cluster-binding protein [Candidatus Krumholzibacteria bacterium]
MSSEQHIRPGRVPLSLVVNGAHHTFQVRMQDSLLDVLRREGWKSVKRVCETADCGACSVLFDGSLVDSCSTLALQAEAGRVETVEALAGTELHPLQQAFLQHAAAQCGFCIPGMLLSMKALLDAEPEASEADLREVMTLCRCTGYAKPLAATRQYREGLADSRGSR